MAEATRAGDASIGQYAARWGIEVAFFDARQTLGVGQARNRTRQAVERTVRYDRIFIPDRAIHFFAGNIAAHPKTFMLLGLFYPERKIVQYVQYDLFTM